MPDFDPTIPVVDMNDYNVPELREQFLEKLEDAFRNVGFVAVTNPGIDMTMLKEAYYQVQEFYNKPLEFKQKCLNPELSGQRGFVLSESAKGHDEKDFKEFYHVGHDQNIWPEDMPEFSDSISRLYKALSKHQLVLEQAISKILGEESNFITERTTQGHNLMRLLHYPAGAPKGVMWAAEHTDIDLFTILPQSTAAGLEVKTPDGRWVPVIVPENAFIINCGDMLQNLTNGKFRSSWHRVVETGEGVTRYSIVFFVHPRSDIDLSPLSQFIDESGKQEYPNATQQELLAERLTELGIASEGLKQLFFSSGLTERREALGQEVSTKVEASKKARLTAGL